MWPPLAVPPECPPFKVQKGKPSEGTEFYHSAKMGKKIEEGRGCFFHDTWQLREGWLGLEKRGLGGGFPQGLCVTRQGAMTAVCLCFQQ